MGCVEVDPSSQTRGLLISTDTVVIVFLQVHYTFRIQTGNVFLLVVISSLFGDIHVSHGQLFSLFWPAESSIHFMRKNVYICRSIVFSYGILQHNLLSIFLHLQIVSVFQAIIFTLHFLSMFCRNFSIFCRNLLSLVYLEIERLFACVPQKNPSHSHYLIIYTFLQALFISCIMLPNFLLFFLLCDLHSLSNSSVVSLRFLDFSETSFPGIRSSIHFFHRFFSPFFHKMHLFEKDFYYFAFTFCWSCSVFSLKLVQFVEFSLLFCKSYLLAEAP